jgi:sortase A
MACLVVPWLLPWPGATSDSVAADSLGAGPRAEEGPDSETPIARPDGNAIRRLREATRTQAIGYDVPVSPKELAAVPTKPGPYRKLGRLEIPSLSLSVSYGGGVFAETLDKGPGHWPGTPAPGSSGNAVISGHRNTHTRPFKELDELDPGDKIITSYEDRSPVTFEVVKTTIVPEAVYRDFVLRQPTDARARELTLFACHPEGNPVFRIVVEASAQR